MAYGTNNAAITTNDLLKQYQPTVVQRLEEQDAFGTFFMTMQKPAGIEKTMNFVVDSTANEADQQPPLAPRIGKKREGYEIEITVQDKYREAWPVSWEKIRNGRVDEPKNAVEGATNALARKRNKVLSDVLLVNSGANSGTPTDPAAASVGETAYWWNTNDTIAPPTYGNTSFSAGHDHVETGVTALTLDRLRIYMQGILEHGYGNGGLVAAVQTQEERTLLSLGNTAQQNQTSGVKLRDEFQAVGRASAVNGLMGLEIIVSQWVSAGVVGMWDANLAGLPQGGALRLVAQDPVTDIEDDKNVQATWFEAYEQYGAGVLHKGAGYVAHVA